MYIIISHDVDHLFGRDHWFRDLSYPKLWVRSTIQWVKKEIALKEWWLRCISCFKHNRNHIDEIMKFDRENGVPSTFFFGMNQGLGLSYKPEEAKETILKVYKAGFDVGVHGICYKDKQGIKNEYDKFVKIIGFEPCGIRMHYVRFDDQTFKRENEVGYHFDSSEFDKASNGTRKNPYKVGNMWEFPLAIMDGYLPQKLETMKNTTLEYLRECEKKKVEYVTILFHDCYFCDDYQDLKNWYIWLIQYLKENYSFISFNNAMKQMENRL